VDTKRSSHSRSTSTNPNNRYTVQHLHAQPLVTTQHGYSHPNVPRTPNPLSSPTRAYSSGGSTAYDDEGHEDGNYHAYPISRS
jgi:hypothetical protein